MWFSQVRRGEVAVPAEGAAQHGGPEDVLSCPAHLAAEAGFYLFGG